MRVHYFDYNGKRYDYGTIVKMSTYEGDKELTFVSYDPEKQLYLFKMNLVMSKSGYRFIDYDKEMLDKNLIEITNKIDTIYVKNNSIMQDELTLQKELQIDGLFLGWVWYIFLMGITFIFNGFYFYWAIISFCFFIYRYGKLKEEGYK